MASRDVETVGETMGLNVAYLAAAHSIHTVRWVNEIVRRGHRVTLITLHRESGYNPIDSAVNIEMLPFGPPIGYFANTWHLRRLLKKLRPQLLHTHYAGGYGTLSSLCDFHPTLLSVWGSDVFVVPYERRWKEKLVRYNLRTAEYIGATSYAIKEQTERFVIPKHAITVTPFGIDCEMFRPLKKPLNNDEFIVGTVKTLEPVYGIEYLIRAFAIFKLNYKGVKPLRLLIAGDGPLRDRLMSLAKELGIRNETEFLGIVPHNDVPNILNRLSVYVCVSNSEGFGVSVLEASACSVPVIASDVGGLGEVVRDGVTGFIVPPRDAEAIAERIEKLAEDLRLSEGLGTAGREFVKQYYEWKENVSRMEELYRKIVKNA